MSAKEARPFPLERAEADEAGLSPRDLRRLAGTELGGSGVEREWRGVLADELGVNMKSVAATPGATACGPSYAAR